LRAVVERVTGTRDLLIRLRIEGGVYAFDAGQYLEVLHPDGRRVPLSIASAPADLPHLDIIYRSIANEPLAEALDELLAAGSPLELAPAAGKVRISPAADEGPVLLIAGGTGIGQVRSIARHLLHRGKVAATVLWCLDEPPEAHLAEDLARCTGRLAICVDADRSPANRGLASLSDELSDPHRPRYARVIASGSPPFVYAVVDCMAGADAPAPESDVFAFAPR
jgi:CDP-4-dehydro-6-deoxyglucose reductase